jgi:hypothetical protein
MAVQMVEPHIASLSNYTNRCAKSSKMYESSKMYDSKGIWLCHDTIHCQTCYTFTDYSLGKFKLYCVHLIASLDKPWQLIPLVWKVVLRPSFYSIDWKKYQHKRSTFTNSLRWTDLVELIFTSYGEQRSHKVSLCFATVRWSEQW